MRQGSGQAGDRNDELDQIRRSVALLAEAVGEALDAMKQHIHAGEWDAVDHGSKLAIDRALGRLDAVRSALGVGGPFRDGEDGAQLEKSVP